MAARRELWEETGFDHSVPLRDLRQRRRFPLVEPWASRYAPGVKTNLEHWFLACLPGRRQPRLRSREHRRWQWLPASRAAAEVFSWTNREAIQTYCGFCRVAGGRHTRVDWP